MPGIDPRIERLEGDIRPKKKHAEALTIVRVDSAVQDGSALLVIILKSHRQKKTMKTLEDGTAHGGTPH